MAQIDLPIAVLVIAGSFHLPLTALEQPGHVIAITNHELDDFRHIRCPSAPVARFPRVFVFASSNGRIVG
jgi:hypothetical protein